MKLPLIVASLSLCAVALCASAPAAGRRCVALGALPDPDPLCTPGAIETADTKLVCSQSSRERRHVTEAMKRAVRESYGIADGEDLEIDHLIPLELGTGGES